MVLSRWRLRALSIQRYIATIHIFVSFTSFPALQCINIYHSPSAIISEATWTDEPVPSILPLNALSLQCSHINMESIQQQHFEEKISFF